ncbi:SAM-dependent methyltransferase [Spongiactinospora sp. TRM90649]|uniref:TRM11 family SAM-dependent methyltransferase n=1 Tax=Spongiactinospora sp. TRM90649 TaxID=3031114 RepID=UPI0023F8A5AB|nr:SAM-dependent methyltransferase [Spongiactinospora sp. TRM90649]MDF5753994.1 SAM-dependent methyltransferase [Spongiactinospora sp. TRM90649]
MASYALLILPAFNRVYGESAIRLTQGELEVFNRAVLGGRATGLRETRIGGVPYVTFEADRLGETDVRFLSNLSSMYALFEREGELLRPIEVRPLDVFPSDLITILKYAGKTNEHFTRLLLNVTALSAARPADMLERKLSVLDPMCGRGTTLNQALMYGYDATGIDLDGKDFDAYSAFLRTWLKNHRLKHAAETAPVRRERALVGRRFHVEIGRSKERYKAGEVDRITMISADTLRSRELLRARSFDLLVTDAPYGVQHGTRGGGGLARSPLGLLRQAVPLWRELVRPGGAIGISFNTYVAKRDELADVLAGSGLEVLDDAAYRAFEHRVDQAIVRDILVARVPGDAARR